MNLTLAPQSASTTTLLLLTSPLPLERKVESLKREAMSPYGLGRDVSLLGLEPASRAVVTR